MEIKLSNSDKIVAIIDDIDYPLVSKYRWMLHPDGYIYASVYKYHYVTTKVYLHRVLLGLKKGELVDHINRNKADCRRENLRLATFTSNAFNREKQKEGSSKYKGVYWNKINNKWIAQCGRKYLGSFKEEKEAALAYNEHASKLDKFACLNKIEN